MFAFGVPEKLMCLYGKSIGSSLHDGVSTNIFD